MDPVGMVQICNGHVVPLEPGDPLRPAPASVVIPLYEDCVLYAAQLVTATPGLRGVGLIPALSCVDRLLQRRALDPTGLNPMWGVERRPPTRPPWVVKFPASTLSQGVRIVGSPRELQAAITEVERSSDAVENVQRVANCAPTPYRFLVESFIEGDQFEISGVAGERGEILHWFHALAHDWTDDNSRIERYRRADNVTALRLRALCARVVRVLGLEWCGFCAEFKGGRGHPWKIIEIHARLGQDVRPDYYAALTGLPPEPPETSIASSDRILIDVIRQAASV